jgi:hypothetical protein
MKRILLLLCALLLITDLADDGFLGKPPLLGPRSPARTSFASLTGNSGTITPQVWVPLPKLPNILRQWQEQPVLLFELDDILPKIDCPLLSSSGGIPL